MRDNYTEYIWPKHKKPCETCMYKMLPAKIGVCGKCIYNKETVNQKTQEDNHDKASSGDS